MHNLLFHYPKANLIFSSTLGSVEYDGQLSTVAYIILAVVSLGIIAGLGWCFYRALTATDKDAPIQHPDEVGEQSYQK